jgi:hypothetical protein
VQAFNYFFSRTTGFHSEKKEYSSNQRSKLGWEKKKKTHRTKAIIFGGSLSFVWKNLLLLMVCGTTKPARDCSSMVSGSLISY